MSWKEVTVVSEKERFIKLALQSTSSMSMLCEEFSISRDTGYRLLARYRQEGWQCLHEHSRQPHCSPRKTNQAMINLILRIRSEHPHWGGQKIYYYLEKQGYHQMPSIKTIQRILKRNGCINPEESIKHKPYIRFEHAAPNDLWQMDFKGHFETLTVRCHPLTLLDDHSRFSLGIRSCANEQRETVIAELTKIFRQYGLPKRMTMDNGSPWGYSEDQRYTKLTLWLIRLGIRVSHSRPYHPQTQGKLERFHRTLKLELLSEYDFDNLKHAQKGFDWWRQTYNEERPHQAIGFIVPAERYQSSDIVFPKKLTPIEYDTDYVVRKIGDKGILYYKGKRYRITRALSGYSVGLKPGKEDELLDVYFCQQNILTIDLKQYINY